MHVCQSMKKKEHFKWKQAKYCINYHSDTTLRKCIPILYKTNNHSCLNMWHISTMRQSLTVSDSLNGDFESAVSKSHKRIVINMKEWW